MANELQDVSDTLVGAFQNPGLLIGIPLALLGAVFMSFGAQYQHRGVTKVEKMSASASTGGLTGAQLGRLLTRPSWVVGTLMLGLAIVCQLGALAFAPLIVVQPLGAIALVITTLLNAQVSGHKPTKRSLIAIAACVGGIFVFVTIAALYATDAPVSNGQLITILILLGVVTIVFAGLWIWQRKRVGALFYIVAAGVIYGFVATLAKVVITRIQNDDFEWLTFTCLAALLVSAIVGAYFVQTAYSSGPPDLVIAGLTVVDPMVAILIGLIVLNEAAGAPIWVYVAFGVVGAIAVWGVFQLARYHPQILSDSQEHADPARQQGRRNGCRAPEHRIDPGDRGGLEGLAGPADQRQGRRPDALRSARIVDVDDDPAVFHQAFVTGGGCGSRHLDLSLPIRPGLLGGWPPDGVEAHSDAGERAAAALELAAEVVALEPRCDRYARDHEDDDRCDDEPGDRVHRSILPCAMAPPSCFGAGIHRLRFCGRHHPASVPASIDCGPVGASFLQRRHIFVWAMSGW